MGPEGGWRAAALLLAVATTACTKAEEPDTSDTEGDEEPPLAPPVVAVAGATFDGAFKSTCSVVLDLADSSGNAVSTATLDPFDGGLWGALSVSVSAQTVATITWDDCENTDDGTGTFTSSTFSGEEGDLFVLHYDGVDAGFEWMVQRDDFEGGAAHVELAADADSAAFDELVEGLGARSTPDADDTAFTWVRWDDEQPVGSVLSTLTASPLVAWAEPEWIEKPAWW